MDLVGGAHAIAEQQIVHTQGREHFLDLLEGKTVELKRIVCTQETEHFLD